eukprot:TRINITY_DN28769_c0_g1_i1.p1 TRINITY_DN28769_c0_g1~~TRINITY_DN28769_c0_g1_i1.p1  ORF type:complete len:594 (-),score=73.36 TRINITY_DN28769_c0_g1_i1:58-1839(-)
MREMLPTETQVPAANTAAAPAIRFGQADDELHAALRAQFQTMKQDILRDIRNGLNQTKNDLVVELTRVVDSKKPFSRQGSPGSPQQEDQYGGVEATPNVSAPAHCDGEVERKFHDPYESDEEELNEPTKMSTSREAALLNADGSLEHPETASVTRMSHALANVVTSEWFTYLISALVFANAIVIGIETDYTARNGPGHSMPGAGELNAIFGVIFTCEVLAKMTVYGCRKYFTGPQRAWNWFDFLVVSVIWVEHFFMLHHSTKAEGARKTLSYLKCLKMLRLARILRMVRLIHLVNDLRSMVLFITGSLKPLFWACVLFIVMIYGVAVSVTQVVNNHREAANDESPELNVFFSDLGTAMITFWQCISGGISWEELSAPLIQDVSPIMGLFCSFYVAFSMLAMMNVITGIFVENATKYAQQEEDGRIHKAIASFFHSTELNNRGEIEWKHFNKHLQSPVVKSLFDYADVEIEDAEYVFQIIDDNSNGAISPTEFYAGWMRLRGGARSVDLLALMHTVAGMEQALKQHIRTTEQKLSEITGTKVSSTLEKASPTKRSARRASCSLDIGVFAQLAAASRRAGAKETPNGYLPLSMED